MDKDLGIMGEDGGLDTLVVTAIVATNYPSPHLICIVACIFSTLPARATVIYKHYRHAASLSMRHARVPLCQIVGLICDFPHPAKKNKKKSGKKEKLTRRTSANHPAGRRGSAQ